MNAMPAKESWHAGVSRYQWLVLAVASLGWALDAFEGQIFNITRNQLLSDVLALPSDAPLISKWGDFFIGVFLAGGTLGGIFFGWLADRIGRRPTLVITILVYAFFSGLTAFVSSLWQVGVLRFLVAMGVGGEWAVAAALVSEVFPARARAQAGGIFHASSIAGTWLAALAGMAVGSQWRYAFLVGALPALLGLWVRLAVRESACWTAARDKARQNSGPRLGSFTELFTNAESSRRAILGMLLASVGLGSFWSVGVAGQDLAREMLLRSGASAEHAAESAKFAYGIVQAAGAGLGMIAFGPLSARWGRKATFVAYQAGALFIIPVTCFLPSSYLTLLLLLPFFGALILGMHAGFAVYFPELFPDNLRATGAGFCFNGGRLAAGAILISAGLLKSMPGMDLRVALTLLGLMFVPGILVVLWMPETRGRPLGCETMTGPSPES